MALSLDLVTFVAVLVLTLTLLVVNYVVYMNRGRPRLTLYAVLTFVFGALLIGALLGGAMVGLAEQYGSAALVSRWGFTFGWAFLLALAATCAALFERTPEGRISVTLNVVATLLLGFGLVSGLIVSPDVPAFPTSLANLALAAVFTAVFRWIFERRRQKKPTFFARLAEMFGRPPKKRGLLARLADFFRF